MIVYFFVIFWCYFGQFVESFYIVHVFVIWYEQYAYMMVVCVSVIEYAIK